MSAAAAAPLASAAFSAADSIQNTLNRTANTIRKGASDRLNADVNNMSTNQATFQDTMNKSAERQIASIT